MNALQEVERLLADFVALARRIDAAIAGRTALAGQLIRVNRPA
jgi:hypothetical protein